VKSNDPVVFPREQKNAHKSDCRHSRRSSFGGLRPRGKPFSGGGFHECQKESRRGGGLQRRPGEPEVKAFLASAPERVVERERHDRTAPDRMREEAARLILKYQSAGRIPEGTDPARRK
jgi:hypothetical protein